MESTMTVYQLLPSPTFGRGEHPFTTWEDVFTKEEITQITQIGESLILQDAEVGSKVDKEYRRAKTSWINLDSHTEWIFSRLGYVVSSINGKFYGFNLHGFVESLQYSVYSAEDQGYYDWHLDWGSNGSQRKMSVVIQLSEPDDYQGGDLQIMTSNNPSTVEKGLGRGAIFPSFTLHRVTPVTQGTRKTLVAWVCGDQFK
jgi:PKHD-type hydroxylase